MSIENPKNLVPRFFNNTSITYDRVATFATFGKDRFWKEKILQQITNGDSFLDLACGTGILTRKLASKFPNSEVFGIDITQSYLNLAKKNSWMFKNITFIHQDAEKLNLDLKFDYIVSSYIPKYCNPKILIKKCVDHINFGGKIIFHDFIFPQNKFIRKLWNAYFVFLNFIGYFVPSWKDAFVMLPKLIRSSFWLNSYADAMKENGFKITSQKLTCSTSAILIGTKL